MEGIGLFLVIIVVFLVVAAIAHSKEEESKESDNKLVMGDEYIATSTAGPDGKSVKSNIVETHKQSAVNHVISTIYMRPENHSVWVCPNCECENQLDAAQCCVCRKFR